MERYDIMSKLLQDEMDESYNIGGVPKGQQLLKDTFDGVLPRLPKRNIKNNS